MITTLADPITIALAQLPFSKAAVDENLQMHRTYIERAAALGAHFVAFPELSHEIARKFLEELRRKAAASDDGSVYGERDRALQDIEFLLSNPSTDGVRRLLSPTANLQELSLQNGWGDEFNELASKLESVLGIC